MKNLETGHFSCSPVNFAADAELPHADWRARPTPKETSGGRMERVLVVFAENLHLS
jgi:hypothetical protein